MSTLHTKLLQRILSLTLIVTHTSLSSCTKCDNRSVSGADVPAVESAVFGMPDTNAVYTSDQNIQMRCAVDSVVVAPDTRLILTSRECGSWPDGTRSDYLSCSVKEKHYCYRLVATNNASTRYAVSIMENRSAYPNPRSDGSNSWTWSFRNVSTIHCDDRQGNNTVDVYYNWQVAESKDSVFNNGIGPVSDFDPGHSRWAAPTTTSTEDIPDTLINGTGYHGLKRIVYSGDGTHPITSIISSPQHAIIQIRFKSGEVYTIE